MNLSNCQKNCILIFAFIFQFLSNTFCQKYTIPLNVEVAKPKIKVSELHENLDMIMQDRISYIFTSQPNYYKVIDRRDIELINEERALLQSKATGDYQSAAMLGAQVLIESTIKNVKQKIDSSCVETSTPTGKIGNVQTMKTTISNCSLYTMTYSFTLDLSAIDVETGSVVENISLSFSVEGKTRYDKTRDFRRELRRDCICRLYNCVNNAFRESSLFITKLNIPVLGAFKSNDKKGEVNEILILGGADIHVPWGIQVEVFEKFTEKIGNDEVERQITIGNGKVVSSSEGHYVVDIAKGKKEIYSAISNGKKLYVKLGQNTINKACVSYLPKPR